MIAPGWDTMAAHTPATNPLVRDTKSWVDVFSERKGIIPYANSEAIVVEEPAKNDHTEILVKNEINSSTNNITRGSRF